MRSKNMIKVICAVLVMCLAACCLSACGDSAPQKVTVTVIDGIIEIPVEIETGKTVKDALDAAKITLGDKDECEPKPEDKITEDTKKITVKRASEDIKVSLTADGKTTEVTTSAATVQDLLNEQKITLGADDEVSEKLDAKITSGMNIVVKRVEYKEEKVKEAIDFTTEEQKSDSYPEGYSEVTQEGVKGEKEITYKVKYVDGKEESREKVSEKVVKEPVKKIVLVGTGTDSGSDDGGDDGGDDGVYVVSTEPMPDCDADGHGTYLVTYSDGHQEFEYY